MHIYSVVDHSYHIIMRYLHLFHEGVNVDSLVVISDIKEVFVIHDLHTSQFEQHGIARILEPEHTIDEAESIVDVRLLLTPF